MKKLTTAQEIAGTLVIFAIAALIVLGLVKIFEVAFS